MANESAAGRDGFMLAAGHRIYHVYKQSFPMEYWYGLTPDANREDSPGLIDVRSLPEKYRNPRYPIDVNLLDIPRRSWGKAMRNQLMGHALTFAAAIVDGYDLAAHAAREEEKAEREWAERQAERKAREAENIKNGGCPCCGQPECDIPF